MSRTAQVDFDTGGPSGELGAVEALVTGGTDGSEEIVRGTNFSTSAFESGAAGVLIGSGWANELHAVGAFEEGSQRDFADFGAGGFDDFHVAGVQNSDVRELGVADGGDEVVCSLVAADDQPVAVLAEAENFGLPVTRLRVGVFTRLADDGTQACAADLRQSDDGNE